MTGLPCLLKKRRDYIDTRRAPPPPSPLYHFYIHSALPPAPHSPTTTSSCYLVWYSRVKMMRQQLLRSFARPLGRPATNAAARSFSSSLRRRAEVELTVDGKKVSIEGTLPNQALARHERRWLTCPSLYSRLRAHPSLRKGGRHHPPLLLPRETHDCRKLQNVLGRGRARTKARSFLRVASTAGNGGQDGQPANTQGERRCHGVLAGKPPSGLPDLRPGWRVRSPGPEHAIRRGQRTIPRAWWQEGCRG